MRVAKFHRTLVISYLSDHITFAESRRYLKMLPRVEIEDPIFYRVDFTMLGYCARQGGNKTTNVSKTQYRDTALLL